MTKPRITKLEGQILAWIDANLNPYAEGWRQCRRSNQVTSGALTRLERRKGLIVRDFARQPSGYRLGGPMTAPRGTCARCGSPVNVFENDLTLITGQVMHFWQCTGQHGLCKHADNQDGGDFADPADVPHWVILPPDPPPPKSP